MSDDTVTETKPAVDWSKFNKPYKKSRRKQKRFVSFKAACMTVQELGFKSVQQYKDWYDKVKPTWTSKYPYRVWEDEWVSWNHFLGGERVFGTYNINRTYKNYWDAAKFVHTLNLKSATEYRRATNEGKIPDDIPRAPDKYYTLRQQWLGWSSFLGKTVNDKIEVIHTTVTPLIAIGVPVDMPGGYVHIFICKQGKDQLKALRDDNKNVRLLKLYHDKKETQGQFTAIVNRFASPQGETLYLTNNINQLLYELDQVMLWAKL